MPDEIALKIIHGKSLEDAHDQLTELIPEIYRKAEREKYRVNKIDVTPQYIFQTEHWYIHVVVQLERI